MPSSDILISLTILSKVHILMIVYCLLSQFRIRNLEIEFRIVYIESLGGRTEIRGVVLIE